MCCWMQCGEARILVEISCSYIFVGSWQWRLGTVGAPAPAQETLSRQRRTGNCIQMMIYPASSRRWHKCTRRSLARSMFHFHDECNVAESPASSLCVEVCSVQSKCWNAVLTQPSQHSIAQPSSARLKSLALNFSEWNLLISWDYHHYSQSWPPATGPSLAWIIQRNCLIISISLIYPLTLAM